ncbi:MAG: ATP-dependent DNA helicase [Acidimicrobiia bacterium]|nr:ATP-dependent DNA helicase [Acidimicrobiia bacterium]
MPEEATDPATGDLREQVAAVFGAAGALARTLDGYEPRESQRRMAASVADVLDQGGTLLAEAGTGTGKTLAYLVPAILSGRRVLISTGTKNLQEQIYFKDLPSLQRALGASLSATLMKGRANYLCLHRFDDWRDRINGATSLPGRLIDSSDRVLLPMLDAWVRTTSTGDRAELRDLPEDLPLWKDLAADADTCLGGECPRYHDCYVTKVRQRAAESDLVIVNHHLLCADAAVRQHAHGEVLPDCPTLVVDEAHQLEDVATQYFGVSLGSVRIEGLVRDTERVLIRRAGALRAHDELLRDLGRVADDARAFFAGLAAAREGEPGAGGMATAGDTAFPERRARYTAETFADHFESGMALAGAIEGLEARLALAAKAAAVAGSAPDPPTGDALDGVPDLLALQRRAGEIKDALRFLTRANDPDFVYFVEARGRAGRHAQASSRGLVLCAAPIDVSRIVSATLLDRMRTAVLTSATLAVGGSFEYVRARLGLRQAETLLVPSEFDYPRQAILYLPRRMPPPRHPSFAASAAREILELLQRTEGRAFVLFTSYATLHTVQRFLEMTLRYPLLVQGSAPRTVLLERFRATPGAVLLATASFWQGVDVVGDALSCVIVDKLPFASPADPVVAARMDAIKARGGDPFEEYQVPLAILTLQQGLGRLIRHRSDRGVLAVLDPRLRTMGYGRRFLDSLPPAPITMDIGAVEAFLAPGVTGTSPDRSPVM